MSRFDRVILAVVVGLGLVIGALTLASARLGPTIDSFRTAELLDGTLVNSQVVITFTQAMNITTVERNFEIRPRVAGDYTWSGNEMLFIPRGNLKYATTYQVTIGTGAQDSGGTHLSAPYHSSFTTQAQHLLYLGTQGSERDRLLLASVNGRRTVLGPDNGTVTDYSVSLDGTLVAFVRRGADGERADEIWLLSLADGSTQRVFRRPDWDISQAHLSPDRRYIVFLASNVELCRQYYGCYRDSRPEIYLHDLRSGKTFPFRSLTDVPLTDFIDFSPHGQIAYTDLGSPLTLANPDGTGVIHIPNEANSLVYSGFDAPGDKAAFVGQTPSSTGGDVVVFTKGSYIDVSHGVYDSSTPAFSSTGRSIAYAAYRGEQGIEPIYGVNVYDFTTSKTYHLTAQTSASDWAPVWSRDDRYLAFVRSVPQEAMYLGAGEIWVVRPNGLDARPLGAIGREVSWVT
jgi:Tol biopolymer transport system component